MTGLIVVPPRRDLRGRSRGLVVPAPPFGMVVLRAAGCDPEGNIRFVCDQAGPEDLVAVPGSAWLIASAYGADGGLNLIDTKAAVVDPFVSRAPRRRSAPTRRPTIRARVPCRARTGRNSEPTASI